MNFNVKFRNSEHPEVFSTDDYEDTPEIILILEELSSKYNGIIELIFSSNEVITIDFSYDFIVDFEDICKLMLFLKNTDSKECNIWFCEQGADYYLNHSLIDESTILFNFKSNSDNFTKKINKEEYLTQWKKVFKEIYDFIILKFPKFKTNQELKKLLSHNDSFCKFNDL